MVLFLLGIMGLIIAQADLLSRQMKENVQLTVFFKSESGVSQITKFQNDLESNPAVKETRYVSKEEAAEQYAQELGQDFISILQYNPLLSSVEVFVNSAYADSESIAKLSAEMQKNDYVKEVVYQVSLLEKINRNVKVISIILLVLVVLFLIISVALINSAIRLNFFSQRFIIKSMQLVGATRWFIMKPYLLRALFHGFFGALIAFFLLSALLYLSGRYFSDFLLFIDPLRLAFVYGALLLLGIIITFVSSMLAMIRFLGSKIDDLY